MYSLHLYRCDILAYNGTVKTKQSAAATLEASYGMADSLGGANDMRKYTPNVPKLCACGCGQSVPVARFPTQQRQYISGHQPTLPRPLDVRFWAKVEKRGPDDCWQWQGSLDRKGYGVIKVGKGKIARAHRVSWILAYGDIDDTLFIMHSCDNPGCVNPAHMSLGTCADNLKDMRDKGRHVHGETHPFSKLTAAQVTLIRTEYASGNITQQELAAKYGVGPKHISRIVTYRRWKT